MESRLVRRIMEWLRGQGFWCAKMHGSIFVAGLPDVLAIRGGRAMWLEVKAGRGRVTRLQAARMEQLEREAGCVVAVVRSVDDARAAVERFVCTESGQARIAG